MYVRLAFAVAAHLEPDILIIDEVLAVGDAEFQRKCLGKMENVAKQGGATVIFVSHQMNAVEVLCTRALLLFRGALQAQGSVPEVVRSYLQRDTTMSWTNVADEYDNLYFRPTRLALVDAKSQTLCRELRADEIFGVLIEGQVGMLDVALVVGYAIYSTSGALLFWSTQTDTAENQWPKLGVGFNRLVSWIPRHFLNEGDYRIELIVSLHWRAWLCQPDVDAPVIHFKLRAGLSESPHWILARPGLLAPILPFEVLPSTIQQQPPES
jgi:lipopolysaccharide transport system ATP-binding protein